jgi:hypothetical protein
MIPGRATSAGTAKFTQTRRAASGHWRQIRRPLCRRDGHVLGKWDDATDAAVAQAARRAIARASTSWTARSTTGSSAERSLGPRSDGIAARFTRINFSSARGRYPSFEGQPPADPAAWFGDVRRRGHHDFRRPRRRLALHGARVPASRGRPSREPRRRTIDVTTSTIPRASSRRWGEGVPPPADGRVRRAREVRRRGEASRYGVATWKRLPAGAGADQFRSSPDLACARGGGEKHRFRVVQLPLNLPDARGAPRAVWSWAEGGPVLTAARELNITVFTSVPLCRASCWETARARARSTGRRRTPPARSFARSAPGVTAHS